MQTHAVGEATPRLRGIDIRLHGLYHLANGHKTLRVDRFDEALLTQEQSQARFEKAKAELQAQNLFLARHWKAGSETYDKMIRARVIRALAAECTDLVLIYPRFRAKYPWYYQSTTPNLPG